MNETNARLSVKELAAALGVSKQFVYQMRACGFPMLGHSRHSQRATVGAASKWIKTKNFRLADGRGLIGAPRRKTKP